MGKTHIICYRRLMTLKLWQEKQPKIKHREKKKTEIKPQWDTTLHPLEWPYFKKN